jgi:hypothetical protein
LSNGILNSYKKKGQKVSLFKEEKGDFLCVYYIDIESKKGHSSFEIDNTRTNKFLLEAHGLATMRISTTD